MRKLLKWTGLAALVPAAIAVVAGALLYIPPVQNWAVQKVAQYASEKTGMEISVGKVKLDFPFNLGMEDVKVIKPNDSIPEQKDTVADIRKVVADVKLLPLLKKQVKVDELSLQDAKFNTSDLIKSTKVKGNVGELTLRSNGIDLKEKQLQIDDALLKDADVSIALADSVPPDSTSSENIWKIKVGNVDIDNSQVRLAMNSDSTRVSAYLGKANVKNGDIDLSDGHYKVGHVDVKDGMVDYHKPHEPGKAGFDGNHISLRDVNLNVDSLDYKGSDLSANINNVAFKEKGSGIDVKELSGPLTIKDGNMQIKGAKLHTSGSEIEADINLDLNTFDTNADGKLNTSVHAKIGKNDLMGFVGDNLPESFKKAWPDKPLEIDGAVKGNMQRLDFHDLNLDLPTAFHAKVSGHAENLDNTDQLKADVDFDVKARDVAFVKQLLPADTRRQVNIPKNLSAKGNVKVNNQKYTARVIAGENNSQQLNAAVEYDTKTEAYAANVKANDMALSHYLPGMGLGNLTGNIQLNGKGTDFLSPRTKLHAKADIKKFAFGDYVLDNTKADATINNGRAIGKINSENPSLKGDIDVNALLSTKKLDAHVNTCLERIDFHKLGLVSDTLTARFCGRVDVASDMKKSYSAKGIMTDIVVNTSNDRFSLNDLTFNAFTRSDSTHVVADCGELHLKADAHGGYEKLLKDFDKLNTEFKKQIEAKRLDMAQIKTFMPEADIKMSVGKANFINEMLANYGYEFKNATLLLNTSPEKGITGKMNGDSLIIKGIQLDTVRLSVDTQDDMLCYTGRVSNNKRNPQYTFRALLDGKMGEDSADAHAIIYDSADKLGFDFGVNAFLTPEGVRFSLKDKSSVLGYTTFVANDDNYILVGNDKKVRADLLLKSKEGTGLYVYTEESDSTSLQDITVSLNKFDIEQISSVIPYMPLVGGTLNGDFHLVQTADKFSVSSDIDIQSLSYENSQIGDVGAEFVYMPRSDGSHYVDGILKTGDGEAATIQGSYGKDSQVDVDINLLRFPLSMLNGFLPAQLLALKGYGEGALSVKGQLSKPDINGEVYLDSASIYSMPYGVEMRFANDPVRIQHSKLLFENFEMYANNDSPLNISGALDFSNLSKMMLDVRMRANNFLLIDAKENARSEAYGKAYVDFFGRMSGPVENLKMSGRLDVLGNTDMTYVLRDSELATDTQLDDLVKFVNFDDTTKIVVKRPPLTGFTMDLTMNIDESAHILCALNADKSNYIDLMGGGDLRLRYNTTEELRLNGRYTLNNGQMKYSLPVIPLKTFDIQNGSYIEFTGEAMNPTLNITATENVKASVTDDADNWRSVDFVCGVKITQTLENPGIQFIIQAPNDITITDELNTMSQEERGKLAVTMLASGMYLNDGNTSSFTMNNALNTFLQSEINNLAGTAMKSIGLDVGMSIDNTTTASGSWQTDYNFTFSKRLWDNRLNVIVGGKVSSGHEIEQTNNDFFSNLELQYRLNKKESQYLRLFYDNNKYDWLEGVIGEYGVGYMWKRKVQHFKDIFKFKSAPEPMPSLRLVNRNDSIANERKDIP